LIDVEKWDMNDETKDGGQNPPETLYGKIVQDGQEVYIEKTRRAMALKLSGASYAAIAQHLGYSDASAARKAVIRGMKKAEQENASELRRIHYGRLEHILTLLWPDVNAKDMPSINTALSVMDRMSVLFGLNAAEKLEVSQGAQTVIVADGDKDAYIRALQEAGREITGEVGSSSHDLDVGDEDDDAGEAAGDD
jgi:hypothetical protein